MTARTICCSESFKTSNEWNPKDTLRGIRPGLSYFQASDRWIKVINRMIIWKKNQLIWRNPQIHFIYDEFYVTIIRFETRSPLFKVRYFYLHPRAFVSIYCRQLQISQPFAKCSVHTYTCSLHTRQHGTRNKHHTNKTIRLMIKIILTHELT